ncbi:hypothetical protein BDY24DRAFT_417392 [Mrakia frigida]|uniref:putative quinol monooxygenase n=1 Tax=Mrakia frigida TaxID=29902 RepID=UPI003FCBF463
MSSSIPDESYVLLVRFCIKEEHIEQFQKAFKVVWDKVVREKECSRFEFLQDAMDPSRFACVEHWDCSLEHLKEVQLNRDYYVPYVEETEPMWKEPREVQIVKRKLMYP